MYCFGTHRGGFSEHGLTIVVLIFSVHVQRGGRGRGVTLNLGGPFLSMKHWGHLQAEIALAQPVVIALQEFRFQ